MPQICLARQTTPFNQFLFSDDDALNGFYRVNNLPPKSPIICSKAYSLDTDSSQTSSIINCFNNLPKVERDTLTNVVDTLGDEALTLAAFADRYFSQDNLNSLNSAIGAASTAATQRFNGFEKAINRYQEALHKLWQLSRNNRHGRGPAAAVSKARIEVKNAYAALQQTFGQELSRYAPAYLRAKNRGDALSNANRGITLATRKPNSPKKDPRINVQNRIQASQLANLSKLINILGNAAILADAGFRIKTVVDTREEGGDWLRESSRQMAGFGAGGALGIYAGTAAVTTGTTLASSAGAAGLVAAGPIGWALLGAIVLVGLGVGLGFGLAGDFAGKQIADSIWTIASK